ncbi:MAG: hypothetical protein ACRCYC_09990 [Paraclostridium sp.]|uniref:hypothetical protein n=1 Tax=Paraclostridium sp. TaxID=2023273 RepID=UPI003F3FFDD5
MENLLSKIDEMKSNLILKNIESIKKNKYKTISTKDINNENKDVVNTYNYYVKLIKKVKKYLNTEEEVMFEVKKHVNRKLVCLMTKLNKNEIEIFMKIDIRILTGNTKDTYMNCTYYNIKDEGMLYINEFSSGKPNNGYGKIILENLEYIVNNINRKLDSYNHYFEDYTFKYINRIEGIAIPYKPIISQESLNKIYRKYNFEVDEKNNMKIIKYINCKELMCN